MPTDSPKALGHMVFFTLKDRSEAASQRLVASCRRYLRDHPGLLHFSAGLRAADYARPVNDAQFDVALLLVFASPADHDRYQQSASHQQFLAENRDSWAQIRVFDAEV